MLVGIARGGDKIMVSDHRFAWCGTGVKGVSGRQHEEVALYLGRRRRSCLYAHIPQLGRSPAEITSISEEFEKKVTIPYARMFPADELSKNPKSASAGSLRSN